MAQSFESPRPDVVCWSRAAFDDDEGRRAAALAAGFTRGHRAFFVEPVPSDGGDHGPARLLVREDHTGVVVIAPRLPALDDDARDAALRELFTAFFAAWHIVEPTFVYGSPLWLAATDHLPRGLVVYDCATPLWAAADRAVRQAERELLGFADLVVVDHPSLLPARRALHGHVHLLLDAADDCDLARDSDLSVPRAWDEVSLRLGALLDDAATRHRILATVDRAGRDDNDDDAQVGAGGGGVQ